MNSAHSFGPKSTADQVIAGIDLTGKYFLVTGCNSGLGFQTMNALAANGAHVIGLARTLEAASAACRKVGRRCIPVACDLSDLDSIQAAAKSVGALAVSLDAVIANAAAFLPALQTHRGIEAQFQINFLGHFALLDQVVRVVREGGRIVIVAPVDASRAPMLIDFDNLDGHAGYAAGAFHAQSKFALALFAKELSRRLRSRGISVNIADPGATKGTGLRRHLHESWPLRALRGVFHKSPPRGAATQTFLAAGPAVAGITGQTWADCRVTAGHEMLDDHGLAARLWAAAEKLLEVRAMPPTPAETRPEDIKPLQAAA